MTLLAAARCAAAVTLILAQVREKAVHLAYNLQTLKK